MPNYISITDAARKLPFAKRILVVGVSGAGKSTLARRIADRFDLEYQSLDRDVIWLPGWKIRDHKEQRAITARLAAHGRWVMDGNSPSSLDIRLPRADLAVWLRVPRRTALTGLARRVLGGYGRVRFDMAEGCLEQLPDRAFLRYIWNFERETAPRLVAAFDAYGPDVPVVMLRSRREFADLLAA